METYEFSELPSILEEEGFTIDPIQTAKDFLMKIKSVTPLKLTDVAKQLNLSTEALILKLADTDFELFIICPNWELEVDELIAVSDQLFTRAEYDDFIFRTDEETKKIPDPAITYPHDGYLPLTSSHLRKLGKDFAFTVDQYWINPQFTEYISFSSPQKISRADICIDENKLLELKALLNKKPAPVATRKSRSDKEDTFQAVIAGFTYLLAKRDKTFRHSSSGNINKSKIARYLVKALEDGDDAVSSKTAETKISEAMELYSES